MEPKSNHPALTVRTEEARLALTAEQEQSALSPGFVSELWHATRAEEMGFRRAEFVTCLEDAGARNHYGLATGTVASAAQKERFLRGLNLPDFALAQACALGHAAAWEIFLRTYRAPLTRFSTHMTKSPARGQELADSMYSELFGLVESGGQRKSPLRSYSGRGALLAWLRAAMAQRHIAEYRRAKRDEPIEGDQFPAPETQALPLPQVLASVAGSLEKIFKSLSPEDRVMLRGYYLDELTLLQVSRLLGVHESTVSRQLKRLTANLQERLVKDLQDKGMSNRAAQEALGTDPRDLSINLRHLLPAERQDETGTS